MFLVAINSPPNLSLAPPTDESTDEEVEAAGPIWQVSIQSKLPPSPAQAYKRLPSMSDSLLTSQSEFDDLCSHIRESGCVAFDTEFISEHTFYPVLCLAQFATDDQCVAVDPFEVDLSEWWEIMADDVTTVLVHAGQEETRFCLREVNAPPRKLVDVQIAEGLRSCSYPLSYERLVNRVIGKNVSDSETRTDWKRRPLTTRQIDYALDDVRYLPKVWQRQRNWLESKGRLSWAHEEFESMIQQQITNTSSSNWQRSKGTRRLKPRQLAVFRELFLWREDEAKRLDKPASRILRNDLLVDLARRQPRNETELLNSRDMQRPNFKRSASAIVEAIERGLAVPKADLPKQTTQNNAGPDEPVIVKFLQMALSNLCAEENASIQLVGTKDDLKRFVRWHNDGHDKSSAPDLATGWRAELCLDLLTDVLESRVSVRVGNPNSVNPLVFDRKDA